MRARSEDYNYFGILCYEGTRIDFKGIAYVKVYKYLFDLEKSTLLRGSCALEYSLFHIR